MVDDSVWVREVAYFERITTRSSRSGERWGRREESAGVGEGGEGDEGGGLLPAVVVERGGMSGERAEESVCVGEGGAGLQRGQVVVERGDSNG